MKIMLHFLEKGKIYIKKIYKNTMREVSYISTHGCKNNTICAFYLVEQLHLYFLQLNFLLALPCLKLEGLNPSKTYVKACDIFQVQDRKILYKFLVKKLISTKGV